MRWLRCLQFLEAFEFEGEGVSQKLLYAGKRKLNLALATQELIVATAPEATFTTPHHQMTPAKDKDDAISPALPTYAPTRPPQRPNTERKKPPPRNGRTVRLLSATPS